MVYGVIGHLYNVLITIPTAAVFLVDSFECASSVHAIVSQVFHDKSLYDLFFSCYKIVCFSF